MDISISMMLGSGGIPIVPPPAGYVQFASGRTKSMAVTGGAILFTNQLGAWVSDPTLVVTVSGTIHGTADYSDAGFAGVTSIDHHGGGLTSLNPAGLAFATLQTCDLSGNALDQATLTAILSGYVAACASGSDH